LSFSSRTISENLKIKTHKTTFLAIPPNSLK